MPVRINALARLPRAPAEEARLGFFEQFWGLSTLSATLINEFQVVTAKNLTINDQGIIQTRPGLKKCSSVACGAAIKVIAYIPIGSSTYIFLVDADNKLYKCTGSEPSIDPGSAIATLSGQPTILPFGGYAVIMDGNRLKVTQGSAVTLCYDDGNGVNGHIYTNLCGTDDGSTALYSGSTTRVVQAITTPAWEAGYEIVPTKCEVWISKEGAPAGTFTINIYDTTGGTLYATSDSYTADDLTEYAKKLSIDFASANFAGGFTGYEPSTAYRVGVVYASGDATNYVKVHHSSIAAAGGYYYYDGSWHADTTKDVLIGPQPGLPPKASFGIAKENRLFVAGNPDYPGLVFYPAQGDLFDWSSSELAGEIEVIDDDANNFPVGALAEFLKTLLVFGKKQQPFLAALTGDSPADWSLPELYDGLWTHQEALSILPNELIFGMDANLHRLSGIQEFGDLRAYGMADPIESLFKSYFDTDAFSGYHPAEGQYLTKLSGYDPVLVFHLKHAYQDPRTGRTFFPCTDYSFNIDGWEPTAFRGFNNRLYVGGDDGHLYRLDDTIVNDNGTQPVVELKSRLTEAAFNTLHMKQYYGLLESEDTHATCTLNLYLSGTTSDPVAIPLSVQQSPIYGREHFLCEALQIEMKTFAYTKPVRIKQFYFKGVALSRSNMSIEGPLTPGALLTPSEDLTPRG